jgi:hypothetical protein
MASYDDDEEFVCALSGVTALDEELPDENDDDGIPTGWTRVTLERRTANPEWLELQGIKAGALQQMLEQVPEELRGKATSIMALQVRATYAALETQIPRFSIDTQTVYFAPRTRNAEIAKAIDALYETLGIEEDEEDDDGDE